MKALRIKRVDHILNLTRFEIVLVKDIVFQDLVYVAVNSKAVFRFLMYKGDELLLSLPCDEFQFEKFKLKWERFQVNEDYYFDLSDWIL